MAAYDLTKTCRRPEQQVCQETHGKRRPVDPKGVTGRIGMDRAATHHVDSVSNRL